MHHNSETGHKGKQSQDSKILKFESLLWIICKIPKCGSKKSLSELADLWIICFQICLLLVENCFLFYILIFLCHVNEALSIAEF